LKNLNYSQSFDNFRHRIGLSWSKFAKIGFQSYTIGVASIFCSTWINVIHGFERGISLADTASVFGFALFFGLFAFLGFVLFPVILYWGVSFYFYFLITPGNWICEGGGAGSGAFGVVQDTLSSLNFALPGAILAIAMIAAKIFRTKSKLSWKPNGTWILALLVSLAVISTVTRAFHEVTQDKGNLVDCG
jgi:hypothetical protein